MVIGSILWELWILYLEVQNLPEMWQTLELWGVAMIERLSSWKYVYNWLSHKFGFELRKKYDMKRYKVIWLWSVLADILVLQVEDQDQTQR